jgi:predicted acyltransferase
MTDKNKQRIGYLDWMRGLACVLMFQTHCYDSWLGGAARQTSFLSYSELGGTLPAPLFLFLAGVSAALVTDRMRQKGLAPNAIARTTMLRGAEIVGFAYLFRLQEFVLGQPWSPWTDLLRVDVLNIIGLSCPGISSPTSTACTRSTSRSHGSSRYSRGPPSHSRD